MLFKENEEYKITKEVLDNNTLVGIEITLAVNTWGMGNMTALGVNILKNEYNGVVGIVPTYLYNDIELEFAEQKEALRKNTEDEPEKQDFDSLNDLFDSMFGTFNTLYSKNKSAFSEVIDDIKSSIDEEFVSTKEKLKDELNKTRDILSLSKDLIILQSLKNTTIEYGVSTKKSIKKIDEKINHIKELLNESE